MARMRSIILNMMLHNELKKDLADIHPEVIIYLQKIKPILNDDRLDDDECLTAINEIYKAYINSLRIIQP